MARTTLLSIPEKGEELDQALFDDFMATVEDEETRRELAKAHKGSGQTVLQAWSDEIARIELATHQPTVIRRHQLERDGFHADSIAAFNAFKSAYGIDVDSTLVTLVTVRARCPRARSALQAIGMIA